MTNLDTSVRVGVSVSQTKTHRPCMSRTELLFDVPSRAVHSLVLIPNKVVERTLASSKVSRSVFSDSPDIPDTIEGAETEINGTPSS